MKITCIMWNERRCILIEITLIIKEGRRSSRYWKNVINVEGIMVRIGKVFVSKIWLKYICTFVSSNYVILKRKWQLNISLSFCDFGLWIYSVLIPITWYGIFITLTMLYSLYSYWLFKFKTLEMPKPFGIRLPKNI